MSKSNRKIRSALPEFFEPVGDEPKVTKLDPNKQYVITFPTHWTSEEFDEAQRLMKKHGYENIIMLHGIEIVELDSIDARIKALYNEVVMMGRLRTGNPVDHLIHGVKELIEDEKSL